MESSRKMRKDHPAPTYPYEKGCRRDVPRGEGGQLKRYIAAVLASVFLAVCAVALISTIKTPVAEAAPGGGEVETCGGDRIYLSAEEKQTLALHNEIRRDHNLEPFCVNKLLTRAARAHSEERIEEGYFSHDSAGGESFDLRIKGFGYTSKDYDYYTVGENLAWGTGPLGAPESVTRMWMESSGHRKNILDEEFQQIGIGARSGDFLGYGKATMYTADFGTRRR